MHLEHTEAILFRMLTGFFGEERVVPLMSVLAVCGGVLPQGAHTKVIGKSHDELQSWAKANRCLFTVVDADDNPKLVVEFFSGFKEAFSVNDAEHQQYLRPILQSSGINYLTISQDEFEEMRDPRSSLDFFHWLKSKFEDDLDAFGEF